MLGGRLFVLILYHPKTRMAATTIVPTTAPATIPPIGTEVVVGVAELVEVDGTVDCRISNTQSYRQETWALVEDVKLVIGAEVTVGVYGIAVNGTV